jgi:DNA-binding NarL/FixJ family response regulator
MKPIRVLIAEDHQLVRAGFTQLLNRLNFVKIVGEVSNGQEAYEIAAEKHPDVILMDISMPRLNGVEATYRILKEFPDIRIIIISMHNTEEYVLQALQAGALGYLLKDSSPEEFEEAIRTVAKGQQYLCQSVDRQVMKYFRRTGIDPTKMMPPDQPLTARQREVLQLVAEGYSSNEIADFLGISEKTVETHRYNLMSRLNIHDITALVRYAIRIGIISPNE